MFVSGPDVGTSLDAWIFFVVGVLRLLIYRGLEGIGLIMEYIRWMGYCVSVFVGLLGYHTAIGDWTEVREIRDILSMVFRGVRNCLPCNGLALRES